VFISSYKGIENQNVTMTVEFWVLGLTSVADPNHFRRPEMMNGVRCWNKRALFV
jgi:hypothetical protein